MGLDIKALSITSAFNSIKSFFSSQENNSKWKDLNNGAEGNFLMRMLSTFFSQISLKVVAGRREQFHDTANLMSSNIGLAVNNGYSVKRGYNQRRLISFIPNETINTVPKFTKIGDYDAEHGIYTIDDNLTFVANQEMEFKVVVGALKSIEWVANTAELKKFHRFEQDISEDYALYLDSTDTRVPTSDIKKDEVNDKYYVYTNPWKSVSIEYLNNAENATHRYDTETTFILRYIELEDIDVGDFTEEMFDKGTITNILVIENYVPFEDVETIKIKSPIYREVQNQVRSKGDMPDLVEQLGNQIVRTNFKPLTPSYTGVTYLKRDFSLMENEEFNSIMSGLDPALGFGRPYPDIYHSLREVTTLDVELRLTNRYTTEESAKIDTRNIIDSNFSNKFNSSFNIYDLEELLNDISYVKTSRVNLHIGDRRPYSLQKIGDMIKIDGNIYKCKGILGESGSEEPNWNDLEISDNKQIYTGQLVQDHNVVWMCYKRLSAMAEVYRWEANHMYKIGDWVYTDALPNYMFKCVDIVRYTGKDVPDVTNVEVGDFIEDGTIVWVCITYNSYYDERISNKQYSLGDKVNINGLSFEYVGQLGYTDSSDGVVFNDSTEDLMILPDDVRTPGYIYFEDTSLYDTIKPGDVLRVSTLEKESVPFYEIPASELTVKTGIDEEVYPYVDEEDSGEDEGGDEGGGEDSGDITYNIYIPSGTESTTETTSSYTYDDQGNILSSSETRKVTIPEEDEGGEEPEQSSTTVEEPATTNTEENVAEEEVIQNEGWKELEAQKAKQEEIHEWIIAQSSDELRVPLDVLQLFEDMGRINETEFATIQEYYNEYNAEDERQIYLHMLQFGSTRLGAISELKRANQLGDEIADVLSVKYYDVDEKLIYIDRYVYSPAGDGSYRVDRYDSDSFSVSTKSDRTPKVRTWYTKDNVLDTNPDWDTSYKGSNPEYNTNTIDGIAKTYTVTVEEVNLKKDVPIHQHGVDVVEVIPTVLLGNYYQGKVNITFVSTNDGEVLWEQINSTEKVEYPWNMYNQYDFNLSITY